MAIRIKDLHNLPDDSNDKYCFRCQRSIMQTDSKTDDEVLAASRANPSLCIFSTSAARNMVFLRSKNAASPSPGGLRVIRTARTVAAAKTAVLIGFRPLMRRIHQSPDFIASMEVWQHRTTGEVAFPDELDRSDSRGGDLSAWECVIPQFTYRPDPSAYPVAAYLLPSDLKAGERVFLEDLIDDYRGNDWNAGSASRLASAEAIWNGHEFDVQYDGPRDLVG